MLGVLAVPDEIVIGFFSTVVIGMATAIGVLWKQLSNKNKKD